MKKIEAVFAPSKLDEVRDTMFSHGVHRFLAGSATVHEYEHRDSSWGAQGDDDESPTMKVEAVVADEVADSLAHAILEVARARHPVAMVTISPIDEVLEMGAGQKRAAAPARRRGTPPDDQTPR
jgi:nitrogen regulatory protein PII